MQHNDYVNAVKEYLERYDEFSQYVKATRQEIHYCEALLAQDAAPASPVLSSAGGGGGEKQSVEEREAHSGSRLPEKGCVAQHVQHTPFVL